MKAYFYYTFTRIEYFAIIILRFVDLDPNHFIESVSLYNMVLWLYDEALGNGGPAFPINVWWGE